MGREILANYPVKTTRSVSWGQMDVFAHVNNVVYFRWFEDARMAYFKRVGMLEHMEAHQVGPILANTSCRFKAPVAYPDEVTLGASVTEIGEDRFTMDYVVYSEALNRVAAQGKGLIVMFDYANHQKAPLPTDIRAKIDALEQSP